MSEPTSSTTPPTPIWDADLVFHALGEPIRRSIMASLAGRPLQTATELCVTTGRRLDATLKHLIVLRAGKLVVTEENPRDGRRLLYRLAPEVIVRRTETVTELDFGCGVLRVAR